MRPSVIDASKHKQGVSGEAEAGQWTAGGVGGLACPVPRPAGQHDDPTGREIVTPREYADSTATDYHRPNREAMLVS